MFPKDPATPEVAMAKEIRMSKVWMKNGKVIVMNGKVIVCDHCPCGTPVLLYHICDCGFESERVGEDGYPVPPIMLRYRPGDIPGLSFDDWPEGTKDYIRPDLSGLPEGWYTRCEAYNASEYSFTIPLDDGSIQIWYYIDEWDRKPGNSAYYLMRIDESRLVKPDGTPMENADLHMFIPDVNGQFDCNNPPKKRWYRIIYGAALQNGKPYWKYTKPVFLTEDTFAPVPFGKGNIYEHKTDCPSSETLTWSGFWEGGCMAPKDGIYDPGEEVYDECPVVCDVPLELCGEVTDELLEKIAREHEPEDPPPLTCFFSFNLKRQIPSACVWISAFDGDYETESFTDEEGNVHEYQGLQLSSGCRGWTMGEIWWEHENETYVKYGGSQKTCTGKNPYDVYVPPSCEEFRDNMPSALAQVSAWAARQIGNKANYYANRKCAEPYCDGYYPGVFNVGTSTMEYRDVESGTEYSFDYYSNPHDSYGWMPENLVMRGQYGRISVERNDMTPERASGIRFEVRQTEWKTQIVNGEYKQSLSETSYWLEVKFNEWHDFPLPTDIGYLEVADPPACETKEEWYRGPCGESLYGSHSYLTCQPGLQPVTGGGEYMGYRGYQGDCGEKIKMNCKWDHGYTIKLKAMSYTYGGESTPAAERFVFPEFPGDSVVLKKQNTRQIPASYADFYKDLKNELK